MSQELVQVDVLNREIDLAQDIPTVKSIRDKASAIVELYKKQHDRIAKDAMVKVKLRAERKIGELTKLMEKAAGRPTLNSTHNAWNYSSKQSQLTEIGIIQQDASDYERLADIPANDFEAILADPKGPRHARSIIHAAKEKSAAAAAREEGRREVEDKISPGTLPKSYQEKFAVLERRLRKELEAEFEQKVIAACDRMLEETLLPHYNQSYAEHQQVIKSRRGVMTNADYNKIRACLHPDRVQDPALKARYAEAFRIFNDAKICLLDEKQMATLTFGMPKNLAELRAMKQKTSEARKAKGALRR
jgi:hypothetical protein